MMAPILLFSMADVKLLEVPFKGCDSPFYGSEIILLWLKKRSGKPSTMK